MIYTCTFAPSIDYTTFLSDFHSGTLNRSDEVYFYPGGKGINVSRVLKRLNVESTAITFTGGFTGVYIEQFLQNEGVHTEFIKTNEITRINVKIKAKQETELNGPGPTINDHHQKLLLEKINSMQRKDWFVLAGSVPKSLSTSFIREVAKKCHQKGLSFVLDTSGPALKELIQFQPFLIKPNIEELGELFDTQITTTKQALTYAKKLVQQGVQHVIVSMGGEGALLVTSEIAYLANVPQKKVVNTVGSGDSLVSGFISSYIQNLDIKKAFQYGVASGSATAFRSDLCEKEDVDSLLAQVTLTLIHEQDVKK